MLGGFFNIFDKAIDWISVVQSSEINIFPSSPSCPTSQPNKKVITDIKKKFNISKKNQYHFLTKW